jgi:hypothetical protein
MPISLHPADLLVDLAIVCASLPALKPLLVKFIPAFSTRHGSRGYGSAWRDGKNPSNVSGSKASRNTDDDLELAAKSLSSKAYPSTSNESVYGHNIYVSHNFEQHVEGTGRSSDSESQKDLVAVPESALTKHW